jgi:hypothetical protein
MKTKPRNILFTVNLTGKRGDVVHFIADHNVLSATEDPNYVGAVTRTPYYRWYVLEGKVWVSYREPPASSSAMAGEPIQQAYQRYLAQLILE